jgi:hypothetical protein
MTMHIVGPALTMNNTRKKREKITKRQQAELEQGWRERNVRLKEMGLQKETFEQYLVWVHGRGKKTKTSKEIYKPSSRKTDQISESVEESQSGNSSDKAESSRIPDWAKGAVSSKPSQTYTGTKMIGVATMHKSNMVPIFSDEEAQDVARMRRG